jgi:hypothetical protein
VKKAAVYIQQIAESSLYQMNIQLRHVIRDITGTTGVAIVQACGQERCAVAPAAAGPAGNPSRQSGKWQHG